MNIANFGGIDSIHKIKIKRADRHSILGMMSANAQNITCYLFSCPS